MTTGIHHTNGITRDVQANVDFSADLLGLRLVGRTVRHNDLTPVPVLRGRGRQFWGRYSSFGPRR